MSSYPRIVHVLSGGCFAKYAPDGPWIKIQVDLPPKVECRTKSEHKREVFRKAFNAGTLPASEALDIEQARRTEIRKYAAKSCYFVLMTIVYGLLSVAAFATPFCLFSPQQLGQAFLVLLLLLGCGAVAGALAINTIINYTAANLCAQLATQKETT